MGILKTNSIQHPSNANNSIAFHSGGEVSFPKKPVLLTNMSNVLGGVGSLSTSAVNGVANVGILQAAAQIDQGDTGWTTSGTNAYTFVCPVMEYTLSMHMYLMVISHQVESYGL